MATKSEQKRGTGLGGTLVLGAAALFLVGCPLPITNEIAGQLVDNATPLVVIETPTDNDVYLQTVEVRGSASDGTGSLRDVTYRISGIAGVLMEEELTSEELLEDGGFSFTFSTVEYSGPLELIVTATDWNDNAGHASISLQYSGSQLSSFSATPGNERVTLRWDALPVADSYTIYYTDNGTLPSQGYGSTVTVTTTVYALDNLKNGSPHTFLLSANANGAAIYWSGYVVTIPLSQFTLAPRVTGGYREIQVEWQETPGIESYEIHRATSPNGPYSNYSGTVSGASFVDTAVEDGQWYYYKVKPSLEDTTLSTFNAARTVEVPRAVQQVSTTSAPAATQKVAIGSGHAYVAAGSAGVFVYDIADRTSPELVTTIAATDAKDVLVAVEAGYEYLFVADATDGVVAYDITVPTSPVQAHSYAVSDLVAIDLDATRKHLYVIDGTGAGNSIVLLDVADPSSITLVDTITAANTDYHDVTVDYYSSTYTFIYLAATNTSTDDGLVLEYYYYATNDAIYTYRTVTVTFPDPQPSVIAVDDGNVYTLSVIPFDLEPPSEYELWTYSRYPSSFTAVGRTETEVNSGYVADMAVHDSTVYVADTYELYLYDVSAPASPTVSYSLDTPGSPVGIATDGEFAYLTPDGPFFQSVDLSLPYAPAVAGSYTDRRVHDVRVRDTLAYVTSSDGAGSTDLRVLDISDPANPVSRGAVETDWIGSLAISGTYAFVGDRSAGMKVVDISDPDDPVIVGSVASVTGSSRAVDVKGEYVYVAASGGLEIYAIADPANPLPVGLVDSDPGGMQDVTVEGNRAYLLDGAYFQPISLKIVDISNPDIPTLADEIPIGGAFPNLLDISDGYAYVTDSLGGVTVVDIDTASGAYGTIHGTVDPDDSGNPTADGIAAFGDYLFVGNSESGLAVMSNLDPPSLAGSDYLASTGSWGGSPDVTRIYGESVYVADTQQGLYIVRLSQ